VDSFDDNFLHWQETHLQDELQGNEVEEYTKLHLMQIILLVKTVRLLFLIFGQMLRLF